MQSRTAAECVLTQLKVPYWPSYANFILMNIGTKHKQFVDAMRRQGVLVRDRSSDPGCDGCVRITLGTIEDTERGLVALQHALKEIQWQPES